MIFVGMVISTIFQDSLNQLYSRLRKFVFRLFYRKKGNALFQNRTFVIAGRPTNVVVIDGDGYRTFENENLHVHVSENLPCALPKEVVAFREKTVTELEERKQRGESVPWNGKTLSLFKYIVSRTEDFEAYQLDVHLAKNDYYTTFATIHNLDSGNPTLRELYIDPYSFENNAVYELPNAIGICLCVRTKDNKIIFAVRSSDSGYRPGESDVSVVEGINPQYDLKAHSLDLLEACNRSIDEEIGNIERKKITVSVLGLVFDKEYNQWNFIGDAYVDMTQDELLSRRNSGTSGRWELKSLDFVKFCPKDIFRYLSTHKMWDMGFVTVYFTLVYNGYSKERLDKLIKKYLR